MHNLLPNCYAIALSSWSSMMPANAEAVANSDAVEKARARVQNKSWRAKKVFEEPTRRHRFILLAFCTTPVERLQAEMTYLDTKSKGLYDAVLESGLNPISKCLKRLAELHYDARNGVLMFLFDLMPSDEERASMALEMSKMLSGLGSQIWWRFLEFSLFPCRWALFTHPALLPAEQDAVLDDWLKLNNCCRTPEFCGKNFKHIGCNHNLLKSTDFKQAIRTWATRHVYTGMSMERLLASFRQWNVSERRSCEGTVATGMLGQLLAEAARLNLPDPRCVTRRQLLDRKVPLRKLGKTAKKRMQVKRRIEKKEAAGGGPLRPAGGFVLWLREQERLRKL